MVDNAVYIVFKVACFVKFNSPNPKYIQFTIIHVKEKLQIFKFKKLKPASLP